MKKYVQNPENVNATQWDGTKKGMQSLKDAFNINHDAVEYGPQESVAKWTLQLDRIGKNKIQVPVGAYFVVVNENSFAVFPQDEFEANYTEAK